MVAQEQWPVILVLPQGHASRKYVRLCTASRGGGRRNRVCAAAGRSTAALVHCPLPTGSLIPRQGDDVMPNDRGSGQRRGGSSVGEGAPDADGEGDRVGGREHEEGRAGDQQRPDRAHLAGERTEPAPRTATDDPLSPAGRSGHRSQPLSRGVGSPRRHAERPRGPRRRRGRRRPECVRVQGRRGHSLRRRPEGSLSLASFEE